MILNVIFGSRFSDIHCGMRGITKEALGRMDLRSQSWEYASEMVLKSVHMKLRTEQVPIRFLKDREGRLSHHKRSGWFSPWQAAWINLRAMAVYGANFFLYKPGLLLLAVGIMLTLPLSFQEVTVGPITFSLHWMLLGLCLAVLGLQCVYMGILSQVFFDYSGKTTEKWFRRFPYTRTVALSALLFAVGVALGGALTTVYISNGFRLLEGQPINHLGIVGLLFGISGFMTFTFTLLLHARSRSPSAARADLSFPSPRAAGEGSDDLLRLRCRRRRGRLRLLRALGHLGVFAFRTARARWPREPARPSPAPSRA